jgi:thiamine kinase-like enzyme
MPPIPGRFSPFSVVRRYREVATDHGVSIPDAYVPALERAVEIETAVRAAARAAVPCHNDLLSANVLARGARVYVVDYEYAGMGDPWFDLANFSINNGLPDEARQSLLGLYFGSATPGGLARLRLMEIVSDFREAMWGVVQQGISALAVDYAAYARRHFARCLASTADPRYPEWLAAAAAAAAR